MELINSKRLLYTASYVVTKLKPEEQKALESKPNGGFLKANIFRSLDLKPEDLKRLETTRSTRTTSERAKQQRKLFSIAEKLATKRQISTMELASVLAPLSYDAITHFIEGTSRIKELSPLTRLFLGVSSEQRRIWPIGRIHLERMEMYPVGGEKGELVFTVPMAPGETVRISHKEWSTSTREFEVRAWSRREERRWNVRGKRKQAFECR